MGPHCPHLHALPHPPTGGTLLIIAFMRGLWLSLFPQRHRGKPLSMWKERCSWQLLTNGCVGGYWRRSSLFPQLRASADLLMMNKERLTNKQLRSDVAPGLGLSRICQLLDRYQPDDDAPEPLPEGAVPHPISLLWVILYMLTSFLRGHHG